MNREGAFGISQPNGRSAVAGPEPHPPDRNPNGRTIWVWAEPGTRRDLANGATSRGRNWQTFCDAIGRPELADDPDFGDQKKRIARRDEIDRLVAEWTSGLSLDECLAVLNEARLPGGPIVTIAETADEPNIAYRGMIERLADPISGEEVRVPGSPIRSSAWRGLAPDAIPAPGSGEVPAAGGGGESGENAALPLAGVRVIETGQYTTAPHAGRNLAMLGAEVIKIEPLGGDETRGWLPGRDGVSYYFGLTNSGKHPLQLDLRSDEGKAVLADLVAGADVFLENMKPGSLARLGFDWDALKRINPRLIYCAISGFGHDSVYEGPRGDEQTAPLAFERGVVCIEDDVAGEHSRRAPRAEQRDRQYPPVGSTRPPV